MSIYPILPTIVIITSDIGTEWSHLKKADSPLQKTSSIR